jgi:hypothetical protein
MQEVGGCEDRIDRAARSWSKETSAHARNLDHPGHGGRRGRPPRGGVGAVSGQQGDSVTARSHGTTKVEDRSDDAALFESDLGEVMYEAESSWWSGHGGETCGVNDYMIA